jgi:predicted RNase H-like HicB family nuclease
MGAAVRSDKRYPASLTKHIALVSLPYAPTSHHNTYRGLTGETYLLQDKIAQGDDGHGSAWIETFPGFAAWGYSKEEALDAGKETAQAYLEVLVEKRQRIPE